MNDRRNLSGLLLSAVIALSADGQRVWSPQGPGPNTLGQVENIPELEVAGAIQSIATHPADARTIYVGAVNGGIWKTTNALCAQPQWKELLGLNRSLSIGAIAFDPTDTTHKTLIAGTGRFSSFLEIGGEREGVFRTTDAGATWTLIDGGGALRGLNISGVAARGNTLVVSVNDANSMADNGIWRTTSITGTWTRISGLTGSGLPTGRSFDLAVDPANSARLFTNAGGAGIFRSTNSGATWNKVSTAAMDALVQLSNNVKISIGLCLMALVFAKLLGMNLPLY